jgi:hypothetical protein
MNSVNGVPGIVIPDLRQNTPRGVRNSHEFHQLPKLKGDLQVIPGEVAVLNYHPDWFHAHAENDPQKPVNSEYLKLHPFLYVKGDPRTEVLIQFMTGQRAVIKRSQKLNAPAGGVIGLGSYSTVVGLSGRVILNRLGKPVQTRQLGGGGEEWFYYGEITQRTTVTNTAQQSTTGMVGNEFVGLNTTTETATPVERPFVLWNFSVTFDKVDSDDLRVRDASDNLRARSLISGKTGPGEWKTAVGPR